MVITKKDYMDFKGIDLDLELKNSDSDNPTKTVQIYIDNVRDFIFDYIDQHFVAQKFKISGNEERLKKAILHQIAYFLEHGDLSIYNPNGLPELAPNAYRILRNAGLANLRSL